MGRFPGGSGHLPGGSVRGKSGRAGLSHGDLTPHPGVGQFDGPARTVVVWLHFLEEVQHVHCAVGGPLREEVMI
jgi:hypothetical protein